MKDFISGVYEGMKYFGENIATTINSLLLSVAYILGAGTTWLFSKMSGKKFMEDRTDKKMKSYWEDADIEDGDIAQYYRQF